MPLDINFLKLSDDWSKLRKLYFSDLLTITLIFGSGPDFGFGLAGGVDFGCSFGFSFGSGFGFIAVNLGIGLGFIDAIFSFIEWYVNFSSIVTAERPLPSRVGVPSLQ